MGEKWKQKPIEIIDYGPEVTTGGAVASEESVAIERHSKGKKGLQRSVQKSLDVAAMLKAVTEAHSPEEMTRLLRLAADFAVAKGDYFGIIQILRLELEYGVGKPVQRSISATIPLEEISAHFADE